MVVRNIPHHVAVRYFNVYCFDRLLLLPFCFDERTHDMLEQMSGFFFFFFLSQTIGNISNIRIVTLIIIQLYRHNIILIGLFSEFFFAVMIIVTVGFWAFLNVRYYVIKMFILFVTYFSRLPSFRVTVPVRRDAFSHSIHSSTTGRFWSVSSPALIIILRVIIKNHNHRLIDIKRYYYV